VALDQRRKAKRTALLIFAVFAAPVVMAIIAFNFWRPAKTSNYGELLPPTAMPTLRLKTPEGQAATLEALHGKWVMLHIDSAACLEECRSKLYNMRQVRLAQGKHMDQVERVYLLRDAQSPPADVQSDFAGTRFLRLEDASALPPPMQSADAVARIFLIDPVGQLMMRYPPQADPSKMIKDLRRLLKVSAPD
jgi:cytochrome oxidase Cu insertion factor (SCO1/SenC/PrrC family)